MTTQPRIMRAEDTALYLGYERPTAAFYARVRTLGVKPVWGGKYDRVAVDAALDKASGLLEADPSEYEGISYG